MNTQSKTDVDQMLAESFKDLALRMPIDKITIKQITDGAGVIRPTFYNHFQDKYELLEWIIRTEVLDPVIPLMRSGNLKDSMVHIFHNMHQNKKFYKKVTRLEGQNSCESIAKKFIMEILFSLYHFSFLKKIFFIDATKYSSYFIITQFRSKVNIKLLRALRQL